MMRATDRVVATVAGCVSLHTRRTCTGVPRSKETAPSSDPAVSHQDEPSPGIRSGRVRLLAHTPNLPAAQKSTIRDQKKRANRYSSRRRTRQCREYRRVIENDRGRGVGWGRGGHSRNTPNHDSVCLVVTSGHSTKGSQNLNPEP